MCDPQAALQSVKQQSPDLMKLLYILAKEEDGEKSTELLTLLKLLAHTYTPQKAECPAASSWFAPAQLRCTMPHPQTLTSYGLVLRRLGD